VAANYKAHACHFYVIVEVEFILKYAKLPLAFLNSIYIYAYYIYATYNYL